MSQYNPSVSSNNLAKVDTNGKQPQKKKKKKKLVSRSKDVEDDVQYGNSFSSFPSSLLSRNLSNTIEDPLLCNLLGNLHLNELSGRGYISSSESELSDSDTSQVGGKHRSHYIKVRQAALGTLYIIFKVIHTRGFLTSFFYLIYNCYYLALGSVSLSRHISKSIPAMTILYI